MTLTDDQRRCWWCKRPNTILQPIQAYISPVVMRVEECVDKTACEIANILRWQKTGAR